jgi:hypothetical protein
MTRRERHNIESNCVSFDDDCFCETESFENNITAIDKHEVETVKSVAKQFYKSGTDFINYLTNIIKGK